MKCSLDAVKNAHAALKPGDLQRKVKVEGVDATADGVYLRIIVHANKHMGQSIAYARINGIVPLIESLLLRRCPSVPTQPATSHQEPATIPQPA